MMLQCRTDWHHHHHHPMQKIQQPKPSLHHLSLHHRHIHLIAWKSLYQASPDKGNKHTSSQATNVPIQNTPTTSGTLSSISQTPPSSMVPNETMITTLSSFSQTTPSSSILDDILVYPSAPENTKEICK